MIEFTWALWSARWPARAPARPHPAVGVQERFRRRVRRARPDLSKRVAVDLDGEACELTHGAAIAAVTSCTTATDPR
ncbi:MAG: hypothetical protein ACLT98_07585 [Eggerthellaceae bacterium]